MRIDQANEWFNSQFPANASNRGRCIIALISGSWDAGDASSAKIWMLRLGYSGDNVTKTIIAESVGTGTESIYNLEVGANNGYVAFKCNRANIYDVTLIANK